MEWKPCTICYTEWHCLATSAKWLRPSRTREQVYSLDNIRSAIRRPPVCMVRVIHNDKRVVRLTNAANRPTQTWRSGVIWPVKRDLDHKVSPQWMMGSHESRCRETQGTNSSTLASGWFIVASHWCLDLVSLTVSVAQPLWTGSTANHQLVPIVSCRIRNCFVRAWRLQPVG